MPRKINGHWWADRWVNVPGQGRQRIRRKSPIDTKKAAAEYEDKLVADALSISKPSSPNFEAFAKDFLRLYAANNNKFSELESKESVLRTHLIPAFGHLALDQIDALKIEAYKADKREQKKSAKTINNHLTVLRKMLDVAREWKLLEELPPIVWAKRSQPKFDFFSFEEARHLVDGADEGLWRTMILVGLRTGLRFGELRGLTWSDVLVPQKRLVVRGNVTRERLGTPKNGKTREIPLSPEALAALRAWHKSSPGPYVFSREPGKWLPKGECKWPLYRACKKAGLRRVGWHVLRHTFASHLVMRGTPLKAVQELLGHASIEMTMRYAHLSPNVGRDAVAALDADAQETPKALSGHRDFG